MFCIEMATIFDRTTAAMRGNIKLIEKDVHSSCHEHGTRKKNLSPHEKSNLRPSDSALRCEVYYKVPMTHVLHTVK